MTPHNQATTHAPRLEGVGPLAGLVCEALGHWLTVAEQFARGDITLWSPELEELTCRVTRLTRLREIAEAVGLSAEVDSELRRLREAWLSECVRLIVEAIHEDPLVICS